MKRKKLGELLLDRGYLTPANLQKLFKEQEGNMVRLGELILERGLVDKSILVKALEEVSRVPYLDCTTIQCDKAALQLVPNAMAIRLSVLPIEMDQTRLVVAMVEPQNIATIDELRFSTGKDILPRFGFRVEILSAIVRNYVGLENAAPASHPASTSEEGATTDVEFISTSSRQANQEAIREIQAELTQRRTPAVRLVSDIIQQAMLKKASDIHIEPQATATIVRIRVDGILRELESIPRNVQNSLVSRIKILSDMDIGERRAPQDGRFMVAVGSRRVDMRVSTLPTQYGEKVVIRLLETSAPLTSYSALGMPADVSEGLSDILSAPQGMLLVTGPTGSGKSTTLYSSLNRLRQASVNIVTVEDPVEYALPGINQVHVNTKAGLTFVSCLRSILRQDPNIIMVGEIRDKETAEIVMKAAQTGHLVLSTLHTNDSVSAIVRLLDLGIPGYLISSSVTGILAQRLVRLLCTCHSQQAATPDFQARLAQFGMSKAPSKMAVPVGCEKCNQTGYSGRVGIYELLRVDESIRNIVRTTGNIDEIRATARSNGMRPIQQDALDKVLNGTTTLEEVLRVVPMETSTYLECPKCSHHILPSFNYCPTCGARCEARASNSRTRREDLVPDEVH